MQEVTSHLTIQEARKRARSRFDERFERTSAYELLSPMRKYHSRRFELLKDCCWGFRCEENRAQMRGARANRALSLLERLTRELGDSTWLSESEAAALDTLEEKLRNLASSRRKGRRRDSLGRAFRRNACVFLNPGFLTTGDRRALSREAADEALSGLYAVTFERAISSESYGQMRRRERANENKEVLKSLRRRSPSPVKVTGGQ